MHISGQGSLLKRLTPRRLHLSARARWALIGVAVVAGLYLMSPYFALWRLDRTAVNGPTSALSALVEIEAVRDQIRRRLNKEQDSRIGEVSGPFIDWIQRAIRGNRTDALDAIVTLAWLRNLLLTHAQTSEGFWPAIRFAFFDNPIRFRVRIGARSQGPGSSDAESRPQVHLILERRLLGWRVTAAYY